MNNCRWPIILAVSLYVIFFVTAFWSVLPDSLTGRPGDIALIVEEQLAACELGVFRQPKGTRADK